MSDTDLHVCLCQVADCRPSLHPFLPIGNNLNREREPRNKMTGTANSHSCDLRLLKHYFANYHPYYKSLLLSIKSFRLKLTPYLACNVSACKPLVALRYKYLPRTPSALFPQCLKMGHISFAKAYLFSP